jgi:hypothetical protein
MTLGPLAPVIPGLLAGVALLLGAVLAYVRWQRTGDTLALLTSAFAAGLAGLARPELFVPGWALVALVAFAPLPEARRARAKKEQRSAFVMAYAAAVAGVFGLWLLVEFALPSDVFGGRAGILF